MSFNQSYTAAKKRKTSPFQLELGKNFQKDVCKSLMEWTDNISSFKTLKDGTRKEVSMIKFICPHPNCHKKEILVGKIKATLIHSTTLLLVMVVRTLCTKLGRGLNS